MVTMWSPLHSDSPRFTRRDRWRVMSDYAGMSGMESDGAPRPSATRPPDAATLRNTECAQGDSNTRPSDSLQLGDTPGTHGDGRASYRRSRAHVKRDVIAAQLALPPS